MRRKDDPPPGSHTWSQRHLLKPMYRGAFPLTRSRPQHLHRRCSGAASDADRPGRGRDESAHGRGGTAARRLGPGFADGVRFVELAAVSAADLVAPAVAAGLGLSTSAGQLTADLES